MDMCGSEKGHQWRVGVRWAGLTLIGLTLIQTCACMLTIAPLLSSSSSSPARPIHPLPPDLRGGSSSGADCSHCCWVEDHQHNQQQSRWWDDTNVDTGHLLGVHVRSTRFI